MQKAILLENNLNSVRRILSISDPDMVQVDSSYILIDNYTDAPEVSNKELDIPCPVYNTETKEFKWIVIQYQPTVDESSLTIENLNQAISNITDEKSSLREMVDKMALESVNLTEDSTYKSILTYDKISKSITVEYEQVPVKEKTENELIQEQLTSIQEGQYNIEETQLTQLMALADIYETIVAE